MRRAVGRGALWLLRNALVVAVAIAVAPVTLVAVGAAGYAWWRGWTPQRLYRAVVWCLPMAVAWLAAVVVWPVRVNAPAMPGTDAIVMGYPGGGAFVATPARIRELIQLNGPDIYNSATVNREVYTVRASVEQGNTGGPLIDLNGQVLGVVFGSATDGSDTGFVLTAREVALQLAHVGDTTPVSTGPCVPG